MDEGRTHIGDTSRPRVYCLECGEIVYCDDIRSRFSPRTAELRLKRTHKRTGCIGEIQYMAGVGVQLSRESSWIIGIMNWTVQPIDNFTLWEARCHGWEPNTRDPNRLWHNCGLIILVPELCECVYKVRMRFGKPLIVKSWTRCRSHNKAVSGKCDSYHQNGHAADLAPVNMNDMGELYAIARDVFPYAQLYGWGLHCDIRGKRPEWASGGG